MDEISKPKLSRHSVSLWRGMRTGSGNSQHSPNGSDDRQEIGVVYLGQHDSSVYITKSNTMRSIFPVSPETLVLLTGKTDDDAEEEGDDDDKSPRRRNGRAGEDEQ